MAIIPVNQFPGKISPADSEYPQGKARNVNAQNDGTGTPWEENLINDIWGFLQGLLNDAGITPSGNADTVLASDYKDALNILYKPPVFEGASIFKASDLFGEISGWLTLEQQDFAGYGLRSQGVGGSAFQVNTLAGVIELNTGSSFSSVASYLFPGNISNDKFVLTSLISRQKTRCNTAQSSVIDKQVIIGWGDAAPSLLRPFDNQKGVFFRVRSSGVVSNIFAVTKNGMTGSGNETVTDTGILDSASFRTFEIIATVTEVQFYIDESLVATHIANIPSTGIGTRVGIANSLSASKTMRIDWIKEEMQGGRP